MVPEFTLQEPSQQVNFTSIISEEYLLSNDTKNNVAERLVWNTPDFGVPTEVRYSVEGSITENFDELGYESGDLSITNHAITVAKLMEMAVALGLDDDPATTNDDDSPNNTGQVYFRVRAFAGSGEGQTTADSVSEIAVFTISLIEKVVGATGGIEIATWGIVGSGYNDWGAFDDAPFYTTDVADVIVSYATLLDGEIKFRENNEWINDFGDNGADGTLDAGGANIAVTAGDYKITLNLNDNTYTIEEFSWGVVGSGYNDWGATTDAKFYYDYTTDTFTVGVKLIDGEIKFRMNNEWIVDFGDNGADGTLDAGGANIAVTEGHYRIRMNLNDNTYTIEAAELWGVVGSGYNDWGATLDFMFTEVNPDIWIAEIVPLIDGEIKFRINNEWITDLGDDATDGTLDAGGANIPVSSGNYRIYMDIANGTYSIN